MKFLIVSSMFFFETPVIEIMKVVEVGMLVRRR